MGHPSAGDDPSRPIISRWAQGDKRQDVRPPSPRVVEEALQRTPTLTVPAPRAGSPRVRHVTASVGARAERPDEDGNGESYGPLLILLVAAAGVAALVGLVLIFASPRDGSKLGWGGSGVQSSRASVWRLLAAASLGGLGSAARRTRNA